MTDSQRYPFLDAYGIFPPHTPPQLLEPHCLSSHWGMHSQAPSAPHA